MDEALGGNRKLDKVNLSEALEAICTLDQLLTELEDKNEICENGNIAIVLNKVTSKTMEYISCFNQVSTANCDAGIEGSKVMQNHVAEINQLLNKIVANKKKFEELKDTGFDEKESIMSQVKEMKQTVENVKKQIVPAEMSILNCKLEKETLTKTASAMENFLESPNNQLQSCTIVSSKTESQMSQWCTDFMEKNLPITDLHCYTVGEDKVAFEFQNPSNASGLVPRLVLTATFLSQKNKRKPLVLKDIKANHDSLNLVPHLDYVIETSDLDYLVTVVKKEWDAHYPLLEEVASLRQKKYPIDWQPHEGKLCVLLGARASISCTFNIPPKYPFRGMLSIEKIEGVHGDITKNLNLDHGAESLTWWVEYLSQQFN